MNNNYSFELKRTINDLLSYEELTKSSFRLIFNIKKEEDPADWPRVKEILIESDIKNNKYLNEDDKIELIEFINNLEANNK